MTYYTDSYVEKMQNKIDSIRDLINSIEATGFVCVETKLIKDILEGNKNETLGH